MCVCVCVCGRKGRKCCVFVLHKCMTNIFPALSDSKGVTSMLRRRASDVKVSVRKAALQALENIIKLVDSFNKEVRA